MEKITHLENVGLANIASREDADKRLIAYLIKVQSASSVEEANELANIALGDTYESRMVGSLTNSPIGSSRWAGTLLAHIADVGDFMQNKELTEKQRLIWGKSIAKYARHLSKNFTKIPFNY